MFRVTTQFLVCFFKKEIRFHLPGPPIPIRFPVYNESYRVNIRFGFSFYILGSSVFMYMCIAHGVTTVKQYYNSHGLTIFIIR